MDTSIDRTDKDEKVNKQEMGNIPELRFPGFEGEWEEYKLNEVVTRITKKNKNLETERPLTISAQDGLIDQIEFFDKIVASKNLKGYYLLKNGDFAYNKSYSNGYPYGTVKRLDFYDKGAVSTLYICFENKKNIDSNFLKIYFETNKWYKEMYKIAAEGARNHGLLNIAVGDFFNTKHIIPSLNEQKKLADFLSAIDRKIELMEKKYHTLLQTKDNITRNLFCDIDNSKPLLNFNDEKWLNITLDEIGTTFSGLSGKSKDDFGVGSSYFVPYKAIFDSEIIDINLLENVKIDSSEKQNQVKKNDILFTSSSETPEEVAMTSIFLNDYEKCYLNSFSFGYRVTTDLINPIFLNYYLRSPILRKEFYKIAQGSTRYNISKKEILKLYIKYPSIETQEKIVSFILNINNNISNLKKEIELNKEFKHSLLSKMFC